MGFKVPTHREEMGDSFGMYSGNSRISPNQPRFRTFEERQDSCQRGKDFELDPENIEFVGGHIIGQRIGLQCERIQLTTTVINFLKWAKI